MRNHVHVCYFGPPRGSDFALREGVLVSTSPIIDKEQDAVKRFARQEGMRAVGVVAVVHCLCTSDFSCVKSAHTGMLRTSHHVFVILYQWCFSLKQGVVAEYSIGSYFC